MKIRNRLTYANVVSTLCLFLLLIGVGGSAAYAHGMIGSSQIKSNAVKSWHIKNGQVKSKDIKNDDVRTWDIKDNHVRTWDIKDGHVRSSDIKNGTVGSQDLAPRAEGLALAGGSFHHGDDLANSFNRLGGPISVNHPGTGLYEVTIPGASFDGNWSEVIMTVADGPYSHCFVNTASGSTLFIQCWANDGTSTLIDDWFKFVLYDDAADGVSPRVAPRAASGR